MFSCLLSVSIEAVLGLQINKYSFNTHVICIFLVLLYLVEISGTPSRQQTALQHP